MANSKLKWLYSLMVPCTEILSKDPSLISSLWKSPLPFLGSHSSVFFLITHSACWCNDLPMWLSPWPQCDQEGRNCGSCILEFLQRLALYQGLVCAFVELRPSVPRSISPLGPTTERGEVACNLCQVGSLYPWPEPHNKRGDEAKGLSWTSSVREDEQSLLIHGNTSVISEQFPPATTYFSHCDEVLCLLPQTLATWDLHYCLAKLMGSGTVS